MKQGVRSAPAGDEQLELFAPSFVDIAFRDQQDLMENPLCTLGKQRRTEPIHYQVGTKYIRVTANAEVGMATIYDHDILIWAATQIREASDRGLPTSPRITFHPYNLLKSIRRPIGGDHYDRLKDALRRLTGTNIETNVRLDDQAPAKSKGKRERKAGLSFNLVTSWGYTDEERPEDDRMFLDLHPWLYRGILDHKLVLSIDPDYFLLESGIEKWLYRVFRKHAGYQEHGWQFTMRQLYAKCGSTQRFSNFALEVRRVLKRANADNRLPGYSFRLWKNDDGDEIVSAISRSHLEIDDPLYQPRLHIRRRMGGSGFHAPKHDNTAFAALMAKKKGKPQPPPPVQPLPAEFEDDEIPF